MATTPGPALQDLVARARRGDEAAFAQLVARFERPLFAHFLAQVPSVAEAEELAHDTFVRAFLGLAQLEAPERFAAWLYGIARNTYRGWSKARSRRAPELPAEPEERDGEASRRTALLHRDLLRIVDGLPEPYRELLVLRYFDRASCAELAARLGRPVGTVTKQLSRGHALVAERVKALRGHTTLLAFLLREEDAA